jgi:hypothetical protein
MLNLYLIYNSPEKLDDYNSHISFLITSFINEVSVIIKYPGPDINLDYNPIKHILKKSPGTSYDYAMYTLKDRFPEGEPTILKNAFFARMYAFDILKERWLEAEPLIMSEPVEAYFYARDILKDRWIEAEDIIIKDPWSAYSYAKYVLEKRWRAAEEYIQTDAYWWYRYKDDFKLC